MDLLPKGGCRTEAHGSTEGGLQPGEMPSGGLATMRLTTKSWLDAEDADRAEEVCSISWSRRREQSASAS